MCYVLCAIAAGAREGEARHTAHHSPITSQGQSHHTLERNGTQLTSNTIQLEVTTSVYFYMLVKNNLFLKSYGPMACFHKFAGKSREERILLRNLIRSRSLDCASH